MKTISGALVFLVLAVLFFIPKRAEIDTHEVDEITLEPIPSYHPCQEVIDRNIEVNELVNKIRANNEYFKQYDAKTN